MIIDMIFRFFSYTRVYLKTHDVTGSEGFLRCARHFFAGMLTYSRKNDAAHRKKARCPGALGVFRYTLGSFPVDLGTRSRQITCARGGAF